MTKFRYLKIGAFLAFASGLQAAAVIAERQSSFDSPLEAVQALIRAAEQNDTAALLHLFGPGGKDIVQSADVNGDKESRAEFASSAHQKLDISKDPLRPDRVEFTVGESEWPFPVPLVRKDGKWRLDSATGRFEILARRVGRNELNAMEVCRGYAEAQMTYASASRDNDHVLKYAEKVVSSPGKSDGLYSERALDALVAREFGDAIVSGTNSGKKPVPYHGYYFRILKAQGPEAAGGAFSYLVNGKMIGGFALVAWPAEYGVSGVATMLINHQGVIYERDLGASTALQASQINTFNPGPQWRQIVLE